MNVLLLVFGPVCGVETAHARSDARLSVSALASLSLQSVYIRSSVSTEILSSLTEHGPGSRTNDTVASLLKLVFPSSRVRRLSGVASPPRAVARARVVHTSRKAAAPMTPGSGLPSASRVSVFPPSLSSPPPLSALLFPARGFLHQPGGGGREARLQATAAPDGALRPWTHPSWRGRPRRRPPLRRSGATRATPARAARAARR